MGRPAGWKRAATPTDEDHDDRKWGLIAPQMQSRWPPPHSPLVLAGARSATRRVWRACRCPPRPAVAHRRRNGHLGEEGAREGVGDDDTNALSSREGGRKGA